jgi:hypothetical protein
MRRNLLTNVPAYWFAALGCGLEAGDLEAAAAAQRELRRLGLDVRCRPIARPQALAGDAAAK